MATQTRGITGVYRRVRRAARHAAIPHAGNDYRPHLVRRRGLSMVLLAVMLMQVAQVALSHTAVLGQASSVSREQLLQQTNVQRRHYGASPLQLNSALSQAALLKANNMLDEQYWAHTSPSGLEPWHWFSEAQYDYEVAGENLAKGFYSPGGVVTAWMNSPDHRENLLNTEYRDVGFAVVSGTLRGEETLLVVALYGSPSAYTSAQSAAAVLAAADSTSLVGRVGVQVRTLPPLVLGSITLLLFVMAIAVTAHAYRMYLPRSLRRGWYRHHGLYKAMASASAVVVLVILYGGGQI